MCAYINTLNYIAIKTKNYTIFLHVIAYFESLLLTKRFTKVTKLHKAVFRKRPSLCYVRETLLIWDRLVILWAPDINILTDRGELLLCVMWSQPQPISFHATRADKSVPEGTHYAFIKSTMNIGKFSTLKVKWSMVLKVFSFAHYSI